MPDNLPRRRLRAMRDRWKRDYAALDAAYGDWMDEERDDHDLGSYVETMRNLATAIGYIEGMLTARRPTDRRHFKGFPND